MASAIMGFGVSSISTIKYSQRRYLHLHKFQVHQSRSLDILSSESDPLNGKVPSLLLSTNNVVEEDKKSKNEEQVGLAPLWDDGYGNRTVEDYFAASKDICKFDGGPPRWFCPIECASPFQASPTLMFLPGMDGTGSGLSLHHQALAKFFEVRCLHIPVHDRTPFEGLCFLTTGETC